MLGILLSLLVAILWSLGEVSYSKASKKNNQKNIYMYTYFLRAIIYIGVVLLFRRSLLGTYNKAVFTSTLPIITCDLFASLVINLAVTNGKLSVVSPIMASYPVVDVLLGTFLLHEKNSLLEFFLLITICISIILLSMHQKKSRKAPHPVKGIIFSVLYMVLAALSMYFEKSIYINSYTVYDLYYYKGMVYVLASLFFAIVIGLTSVKLKKPDLEILKGCGLTPIGNVLDSVALSIGNITIVTPISSLYAVITTFISRFYLKEKVTLVEKICIGAIILSTLTLIILKI